MKHPGENIKSIATIAMIIVMLGDILGLLAVLSYGDNSGLSLILIGAIPIILLIYYSLCGFGQLVEDVHVIAKKMTEGDSKAETNNDASAVPENIKKDDTVNN